jgi:hypothetical protein
MQCLSHLSKRSVEIRIEANAKAEKPEQAEVQLETGPHAVEDSDEEDECLSIEDEDEDDWSDGDDES